MENRTRGFTSARSSRSIHQFHPCTVGGRRIKKTEKSNFDFVVDEENKDSSRVIEIIKEISKKQRIYSVKRNERL